MSRIGKKPLAIPTGVKVEIKDGIVYVEGVKGKLNYTLSPRIKVEMKENQILITRVADTKMDKSLHGLTRALISNMIIGVSQSYTKELEIIGVGFKAAVQGKNLNMQLGFSHPINFAIPEGIKIEAPKPTQLIINGIDKEKVGEVASELRLICPPEPYKGKGIRYKGEYVKKKIGKAQATSGK